MAKIGDLIQSFIMSNPKRASWALAKMPEGFWLKKGKQKAMRLFKETVNKVPAYRKFLCEHNIDPEEIKTFTDFKKLPIIDKKNYLDQYPLEQTVWNEEISNMYMITCSSGSTGQPYFWPRLAKKDKSIPQAMELMYTEFFEIDKKKTLVLINLALGTWAAGELAAESSRIVAKKPNLPLTVITPGLNLEETIRIFENIGSKFEQTVIVGYPPFVKDVIDAGTKRGLDWKKYNLKLLIGGEGTSEEWRDYIAEKIGAKDNIRAIISLFAAADAGIIGHETPFSILIRRLARKNSKICEDLFGEAQIPSLNQFNPLAWYIERVNDEIVLTINSGIPLIRYNFHDRGGMITFSEMLEKLKNNGYDPEKLLSDNTLDFNKVWRLPFFYVFGRKDAVVFSSANIYLEQIRQVLEKEELIKSNTGRFKASVVYDDYQNPSIKLDIELARGVKPSNSLNEKYKSGIVHGLLEISSEYKILYEKRGEDKVTPNITLWEFNSDIFKTRGNSKHKYKS